MAFVLRLHFHNSRRRICAGGVGVQTHVGLIRSAGWGHNFGHAAQSGQLWKAFIMSSSEDRHPFLLLFLGVEMEKGFKQERSQTSV